MRRREQRFLTFNRFRFIFNLWDRFSAQRLILSIKCQNRTETNEPEWKRLMKRSTTKIKIWWTLAAIVSRSSVTDCLRCCLMEKIACHSLCVASATHHLVATRILYLDLSSLGVSSVDATSNKVSPTWNMKIKTNSAMRIVRGREKEIEERCTNWICMKWISLCIEFQFRFSDNLQTVLFDIMTFIWCVDHCFRTMTIVFSSSNSNNNIIVINNGSRRTQHSV